jgi:hypothetical protein
VCPCSFKQHQVSTPNVQCQGVLLVHMETRHVCRSCLLLPPCLMPALRASLLSWQLCSLQQASMNLCTVTLGCVGCSAICQQAAELHSTQCSTQVPRGERNSCHLFMSPLRGNTDYITFTLAQKQELPPCAQLLIETHRSQPRLATTTAHASVSNEQVVNQFMSCMSMYPTMAASPSCLDKGCQRGISHPII